MSTRTANRTSIIGDWSVASKNVLLLSNDFQVIRVNALAVPAQMVKNHPFGNGAYK